MERSVGGACCHCLGCQIKQQQQKEHKLFVSLQQLQSNGGAQDNQPTPTAAEAAQGRVEMSRVILPFSDICTDSFIQGK